MRETETEREREREIETEHRGEKVRYVYTQNIYGERERGET